MAPIPLSQWADSQGIPRRTAYNWAKTGKLNVPIHRTLSGRLVVLDDEDTESANAHPFVAAYAEALGSSVGTHVRDNYHSPILELWGVSLYDSVDPELRSTVLHLALTAACRRVKRDVGFRLADWLGRVELADWYQAAGFDVQAAAVRTRPAIDDAESFLKFWPTGVASFQWRNELDTGVRESLVARGLWNCGDDAAGALAENSLVLLKAPIAIRRDKFRHDLDHEARTRSSDRDVVIHGPDKDDLWDLRALYGDVLFALARPTARRTALVMCDLVGWDPDGPTPADGHPFHEIGFPACGRATNAALAPHLHAAHMREIDAFRRAALGKPFASA